MVVALDVNYRGSTAKSVAVLFDWSNATASKFFFCNLKKVEDYIPGQFYKRELPCLLEVLKHADLNNVNAIIVDGYVYIDDKNTYGLGGHLWKALYEKIPIIGVAKTKFYNNKNNVVEVYRGSSKNPIFVSSIGIDILLAANHIKNMAGAYRIPAVLKQLDNATKE